MTRQPADEEKQKCSPFHTGAMAVGASAIGAIAVGAVAFGAIAIGALVIRRLAGNHSHFKRLDIDELTVRRLRVGELLLNDPSQAPNKATT
jgi:hypothetical protein